MEVNCKKQIRPILVKMKIYDTEDYDYSQGPSVRSMAIILQNQTGMKFTTRKDKTKGKLLITRIA